MQRYKIIFWTPPFSSFDSGGLEIGSDGLEISSNGLEAGNGGMILGTGRIG